MFAWMNIEALQLTLSTKRMTYWSRGRNQLWVKGETSGHTLVLVSVAFDCDGDAIFFGPIKMAQLVIRGGRAISI